MTLGASVDSGRAGDTAGWRRDIQCLRGVAVAMVVLYHAHIPGFTGGYLGVDVFFVISGFLITRLVATAIDRGAFSLVDFYWRRARRLLPAALLVVGACMLLAPWFLGPGDRQELARSALYTIAFLGNVGQWLQTGYFQQTAELKPLLHYWSLAVEEHYYFLVPALLLILPASKRFSALCLLTMLSLIGCLVLVHFKPGLTFYFLPTRAWELGLGSILATIPANQAEKLRLPQRAQNVLTILACIALVSVVASPLSVTHPYVDALVACGATAILIALQPDFLRSGRWLAPVAVLGNLSYSLYLVHWPILSFAAHANVTGEAFPWYVRVSLILASVLLAAMIYRFVERPLRVAGNAMARPVDLRRDFSALGGSIVVLGFACIAVVFLAKDEQNFAERLRGNVGLRAECSVDGVTPIPTLCRSASNVEAVLWGDSHAMQWADALSFSGLQLLQLTRPLCAPIPDVAAIRPERGDVWSGGCIDFNDDALKLIEVSDAKIVVMSALWAYLPASALLLRQPDGTLKRVELDRATVADLVAQTIFRLRSMGKRVVVLFPAPHGAFDRGRCVERTHLGLVMAGATAECVLPRTQQQSIYTPLAALAADIARQANVSVVEFWPQICDDKTCYSEIGDVMIFRDSNHLSYEGARWLVRQANLVDRIRREAR